MAGTDTITIFRGESTDLNFAMNPVEDISAWTITFELGGTAITKTASIVNGPNGTFKVTLMHDDTEHLVAGHYTYTLWRSDAQSERVIADGTFVVAEAAQLP